jgi:hypothetical protein
MTIESKSTVNANAAKPAGPDARTARFHTWPRRFWRQAVCLAILGLFATLWVGAAVAQTGILINGGENDGTMGASGASLTNTWTFTANAGDTVTLRMAATNFSASYSLYGPDGALLNANCCGGAGDNSVAFFTTTNSGMFTLLVSAANQGGTGSYVVRLAEMSQPFVVPSGPLANGVDNAGTLGLAALDRWSFMADAGDTVSLRMVTTNFDAAASLFGPDGTLLATSCCTIGGDTTIAFFTATNSGVFTVLVCAGNQGGTGSYVLRMAEMSQPFVVPSVPLANGVDNAGALGLAALDRWSFTANAGDTVSLRMAATNFSASYSLTGPAGALLDVNCCAPGGDNTIAFFTATNSGEFSLLVCAGNQGGTGSYVVRLAEMSQPFGVPSVPLANGVDNIGTLGLAALDRWSFTANAGDTVVVRLFATNFNAAPSLYGPDGAQLNAACCAPGGDTSLAFFTANNSGVFTVLVCAGNQGGIGSYVVRFVDPSQPFSAPSVPLANSGNNAATLGVAGLDRWAFTACVGDGLYPQLTTTNFTALLDLYGPDGELLASGNGGNISLTAQATNCGTFTLLVSSVYDDGSGAYSLAANGLSEGLKLCPPAVTASNLALNGIGGVTNATFVLYTAATVPTPLGLWTPIYTNQFDSLGVFTYTNSLDPALPQSYFRMIMQ